MSSEPTIGMHASGRRAEIIRQASSLFAERGYGATTVRDIAQAARMTSGSLYHHFPSKEAILLEAMRGFLADVTCAYRGVIAQAEDEGVDAVVTIRRLVRESLALVGARTDLAVVVVAETRRLAGSSRIAWMIDKTLVSAVLWSKVLRDGVDQGSLRADLHPDVLGVLVQSAVWGMATWYRPDGPYGLDEAAGRVTDLLLGGIVRREVRPRGDIGELLGSARTSRPGLRLTADQIREGLPLAGGGLDVAHADAAVRIRAAAGQLFAQHGFAATTVRQIAELAGVPVGSLTHHIGSKEQLLADMVDGFLGDMEGGFAREAEAGYDAVGYLDRVIRRTVCAYAVYGVATVLLFNELPLGGLKERRRRMSHRWAQAVRDGVDTGDFRADLDAEFAQRVWRTAIATGSEMHRAIGVADVGGLYVEVALGGLGA